MAFDDLAREIERLSACGPLKVWSVVVTILGDLCQARGDAVSGRVLDLLLGRMGITNQALRVALHRLRRDGWIESRRDGRASNYLLSEQGWRTTQSARPIVFAATGPEPAEVLLAIAPPQLSAADFTDGLPDDAVLLSPRTALCPPPAEDLPAEILSTPFAPAGLPDWARDLIAGPDLCRDYAELAKCAADTLKRPLPASLVDRTVLRIILLHHWRRLRLRHGPLPDLLLPADWAGARARFDVMAALDALPRPSIDALRKAQAAEAAEA